jgi:hypothetical protein
LIGDIVNNLLNQINRVTRDIDGQASRENWDDSRTRTELARRLFKPQFISTVEGGIPTVNRGAIAADIRNKLLIEANRSTRLFQGARVIYRYTVSGHIDEGGFLRRGQLYAADHLKLPPDWQFSLSGATLDLPAGGAAAVRALQSEGVLRPGKLGWGKALKISGSGGILGAQVSVEVDANNQAAWIGEALGIFEQIWPRHRMYLGSHYSLPQDPMTTAQQIARTAWNGTGGLPPEVREFSAAP